MALMIGKINMSAQRNTYENKYILKVKQTPSGANSLHDFSHSAAYLGLAFPGRTAGPIEYYWLAPTPRDYVPAKMSLIADMWFRYLRWVRKLPLAWPEPSQPGVGQVGPSFFSDFQEKDEPLRAPSFCLRAASGQPEALLWEAYLPLMWPSPTQPGTGHLDTERLRWSQGP